MADKAKAKHMYETGCKYKDISNDLNIPVNTLKSWRNREKWERKNSRKVAPQNNKKVADAKLSQNQSADSKWKRFCLVYLRKFNATQAYMDVYDCSYETAMVNGSKLLSNTKVKNYLNALKQKQSDELYLTSLDLTKEEMKIAFANLSDFLTPKHIRQQRLDADGNPQTDYDGNEIIDEYDEFILTNPKKADWSVIKSVHRGKDGLVVELYDKQKAIMDLYKRLPDAPDARIAKAKADMLDTDNNKEMSQVDKLMMALEDADDKLDDNDD